MNLVLHGTIVQVLVTTDPRTTEKDAAALISAERPQVEVHLEGFAGDKHAGFTARADSRTPWYPRGTIIRNSRQVSIVSLEELAAVAAALTIPLIRPEWLGANLALEGIPRLTELPPATRFFFPEDAVLVVQAENMPCILPGKVLQRQYPEVEGLARRFAKAAIHRRGLVACVERPGLIRQGDQVRIQVPPRVAYSIGAELETVERPTKPRAAKTIDTRLGSDSSTHDPTNM